MCIIAYKPKNVAFPLESVLKNCYENNPDGAGFMYSFNGDVYIKKGFITWESFRDALDKARKLTGDNVPYVMHFRIATQGFNSTMTHPFPLSSKMSNLKKIKCKCSIGIAHNGIINLTSDGSQDYSDTMKFITDYLSLIIQSYSWYKNDRIKQLIERLMGSCRLAVLDKNNHCELLGKGWIEDNGIFYSNSTYSYKKYKYVDTWDSATYWDNWKQKQKERFDGYHKYYNKKTCNYDFTPKNCPVTMEYDYSYCSACSNRKKCNKSFDWGYYY